MKSLHLSEFVLGPYKPFAIFSISGSFFSPKASHGDQDFFGDFLIFSWLHWVTSREIHWVKFSHGWRRIFCRSKSQVVCVKGSSLLRVFLGDSIYPMFHFCYEGKDFPTTLVGEKHGEFSHPFALHFFSSVNNDFNDFLAFKPSFQ